MALQILNQLGSGEKLGTGLGQTLQGLAQLKAQQLQQSQQAQFWNNIGLPQVASQPESIQRALLERLQGLSLGETVGAPRQAVQSPLTTQEPQGAINAPEVSGLSLGPSSQERRHQEILQSKKEVAQQRERADLRNYNTKVLENLDKKAEPYIRVKQVAQEVRDLIKTADIPFGPSGKIIPDWLQTPEGQLFIAKTTELALLKAQLGGGSRASQVRLRLEQLSKPQIYQHKNTALKLVEGILNDENLNDTIDRYQTASNLLGKDIYTPDLLSQISKAQKKDTRGGDLDLQVGQVAQGYPDGTQAEDESGHRLVVKNGKWEEM